jgi:glycosyltransferase involved in cell wall biosynthesis
LIILDRAGKAPRIAGLRYIEFPAHDYSNMGMDQQRVQDACDYTNAKLFISSYYSTPLTTPSVLMVYDMIPELLNADLSQPMWMEKVRAIQRASAYVCISRRTAEDLAKFHEGIPAERISVSHTGVSFRQPGPDRVTAFKSKHQIEKPYFLLSGARSSYKNSALFFNAFGLFNDLRGSFSIVCTGPRENLQPEFTALAGSAPLHLLDLPDDELECAYAGAIALVYPSLYEGFGMPIIEAMACGCPVITCPNGPIPEVAEDAAIYVSSLDVGEMHRALRQVQILEVRNPLVAKGLDRARMFSWEKMASETAAIMSKVIESA